MFHDLFCDKMAVQLLPILKNFGIFFFLWGGGGGGGGGGAEVIVRSSFKNNNICNVD